MERNEKKIDEIKRDLRQLRKITHSIEVAIQVKERHEKRLEILNLTNATQNSEEINKLKKVLSSLNIDESIKKATSIELKYTEAISKLDRLDQIIILDGYINGKAYWKIGRDIGYTERGIQKRVGIIIEKLSELV